MRITERGGEVECPAYKCEKANGGDLKNVKRSLRRDEGKYVSKKKKRKRRKTGGV